MKKESECEINLKPSRIQLREEDTGYMKENLNKWKTKLYGLTCIYYTFQR